MNSREIFRSVFKRQIPERIPAYPMPGAIPAKLTGRPLEEYFRFTEKTAEMILEAHKLYEPDLMLVTDVCLEPEAFGCKVEFFSDDYPKIREHVIKDLKKDVKNLKIPEPRKAGRLSACVKVQEILLKKVGEEIPVGGSVNGPFSLCTQLCDMKQLLLEMVKNPDAVHELLDMVVDFQVEWGVMQAEVGAGVAIADASSSVLSLKHFEEFSFPYIKKIVEKLAKKRIYVTLHICGDTNHILEKMAETGATALSIDCPVDIGEAKKRVGNKVVLIGNVPQIDVVGDGTPEMVENAVKECIRKAGYGGGYVLCTGCEVPLWTPLENLRAFMNAAKKYGKYPLQV